MNDIMAQSLGLSPLVPTNNNDVVVVPDPTVDTAKLTVTNPGPTGAQTEATNDFEMARQNLMTIIKNGGDAIDALSTIASQSQDPEAFASLSSLMNTLVNANKQLLEIQKRIRDINREDNAGANADTKTVTNNNLFIGTSDRLLRIIKGEL